jgi:hypothetical protein
MNIKKGFNMKSHLKISLYVIAALAIGFLLIFFYQTMVDSQLNRFKTDYNFFTSSGTEDFLLIRGWRAKRQEDVSFVAMTQERSIFVCSIPEKDAISLVFKYRLNDPSQEITVYKDSKHLGTLSSDKPGEWVEDSIIIDSALIDEGLNKFELIKSGASNPEFYGVTATNYQNKNLTFLRAYVVWESTKWFRKRGSITVNWQACFVGSLVFLGFWLVYSAIFWSLTKEKFSKIVRLDFWTYLVPVLIFSILFLISKIVSSYTFFYYRFEFFLILIGSMSVGKIYQMMRYAKRDMTLLRLRQIYECTIKKYNVYANIFISLFIIMMGISAVLLMMELKLQAEWLTNVGFFLLILGFLIKFIRYFIEKEYQQQESD